MVTICRLDGEFDASNTRLLRATLIEFAQTQPVLIVDLCAVTFVDSSALGVLVGAVRRVKRRGGRIVFVCNTQPLQRVFEMVGIHRIAETEPDMWTAQPAMQRAASLDVRANLPSVVRSRQACA